MKLGLRSTIRSGLARRRLAGAAALAAAVAGCDREAAGPSSGAFPLAIAAQVTGGTGAARAFDAADAVAIRVSVGGTVAFEETRSFDGGGDLVVSVALDRGLVGSVVSVEVTLLAEGAPVFRGDGSATLQDAGTSVELDLDPVIARIEVADPVRVFTAIGETARFTGAAVFATGDTVPDVPLTWQALDAGVVAVEADGNATALDAGEARVQVGGAGMTALTHARVDPVVERVEVTPPSAAATVGETVPFEAQTFDRNGNPLSLPITWSSSDTEVATITAAGVATAVGEGTTTITAASGGVTGEAELAVRATPRSPEGLQARSTGSGGVQFELTWQDRSDDEVRFDVERSVNGGPWNPIGSTEANVTRFVGDGAPGTNAFRVSACNANGCSAPSNEASVVFASGPPSVQTLPSRDVGLMRGQVETTGPYRVRFHWGYSESDFLDDVECPCYSETGWLEMTSSGEVEVPIPEAYAGYPMYYRIEAENAFGSRVGAILSLQIPPLALTAPSSYGTVPQGLPVSVSISTPPGTPQSPIQSVQFVPRYGGSVTPATMSVRDSGTARTFIYEATFTTSSFCFHQVDAVAYFRSGAAVHVFGPFMFGPQYPCSGAVGVEPDGFRRGMVPVPGSGMPGRRQ